MWLDSGEFDAIIEYLKTETADATPADAKEELRKDLMKLWDEGPESRIAEAGDAIAAATAVLNFTIFEHPKVFSFLTAAEAEARGLGLG